MGGIGRTCLEVHKRKRITSPATGYKSSLRANVPAPDKTRLARLIDRGLAVRDVWLLRKYCRQPPGRRLSSPNTPSFNTPSLPIFGQFIRNVENSSRIRRAMLDRTEK